MVYTSRTISEVAEQASLSVDDLLLLAEKEPVIKSLLYDRYSIDKSKKHLKMGEPSNGIPPLPVGNELLSILRNEVLDDDSDDF
jgi:hypothetical protein